MKQNYLYFNKKKIEILNAENSTLVTVAEFSKPRFVPETHMSSIEVFIGYWGYEDFYKTYVKVPEKLHYYIQSKKHKDRFIKISKKRAEILHKVMNS